MTERPDGTRVDPVPASEDHRRQEREAAFHDVRYAENVREPTDKFYAITASLVAEYRRRVLDGIGGRDALEYGCGTGSMAYDIADCGGRTVGIDISPVAIELAAEGAVKRGVVDRTSFRVMDAENLEVPDASFDLVCGTGILHHLDLVVAYREIARVLKPGGRAVFSEPLGHNPLIEWYRRRTPSMRTVDEHPLLVGDIAAARAHFRRVDVAYFHLAALAAIPLRGTPVFGPALRGLNALDRVLLSRRSPLGRQAWMVVLEMAR